ncbi:glycine zipper domain-containing protein [Uliginosibacterium sp. H3]|uniref:Glycine zipper domain-containing protein n=1 Tax=Uliginosibacterium silvisoli TaxID=3114758 RepID=A0ABU6K4G5_9RHOO|nr:glycine zipper domain-containing protein [Uliginosibacterium sp. H3]
MQSNLVLKKSLVVVLGLGLVVSGCSSMDSKTTGAAIGAGIGCATGAVFAKLTKNDMGTACAVGAVAGGAAGYLYARNAEVQEARQVADSAAKVEGAKVTPVETQQVQVVDKATNKTETVAAFKAVSVEIPVSQLNTPEGKDAVRKLNEYARKTADERGETIDMTISSAPEHGGSTKVALKETIEPAGKGKVRRTLVADPRVSGSVQRYTIEAKNPSRVDV